jgi:hypothetical protein
LGCTDADWRLGTVKARQTEVARRASLVWTSGTVRIHRITGRSPSRTLAAGTSRAQRGSGHLSHGGTKCAEC